LFEREQSMKITHERSRVILATILALGLAACHNTAEGVKKDAKESADKAAEAVADVAAKTADAAANVAADAAQSAKEAGSAAAQSAREMSQAAAERASAAATKAADAATAAGAKAAQASKDAGAVVSAATNTFDVKAALVADHAIDSTHINVDTDARTRTVFLKGSVPSAEQKSLAEKVAASKATGYEIVNQLEVVKK
jgi:osmotically-inducible protein OsmY